MNTSNLPLECDALLFDLDGVLIDSTPCVIRHWKEWAEKHGLESDMILQSAHGVRTIETIRRFAPHLDAERETEEYTDYEVADTEGVTVIAGAGDLLASLPQGAWAIVTSCTLDLAKARLRAAGLPLPQMMITADDVVNGKPSPEPYLAGARRLGLPVERCIVVEDAPAGVEAGKKAGMRVVGITSTHTQEELLAKGADVIAERLEKIKVEGTVKGCRLSLCVG